MSVFSRHFHDLVIRKKILLLLLALTLFITAAVAGGMYAVASRRLHQSLQARLRHTAITAALGVDGEAVDRVRSENDEAWKSVADPLRRVREQNGLRNVYVMRNKSSTLAEFVVDLGDKPSAVGREYPLSQAPAMALGFSQPSVDDDIVTDEYGSTLSGYAPIRRRDGTVAGLVGVDMDASEVAADRRRFTLIAAALFGGFVLVAVACSFVFASVLTRPILEMTSSIDAISKGSLDRRMVVRGKDEIGRLSSAVNRMMDTLALYLPVRLVAKILGSTTTLDLGGARAPVSVFFSDLAGFTTTSEGLTPEKLVTLINEYFTAMTDIIEDLGGTVDKYLGDAIMAFWGAPDPVDGHAAIACEAAVRQLEALARMQREWKAQGKPHLQFRIGINSGEAVVGNMGSRTRFNYTAMGDVVNLASRLEGAAKNYGTATLIGESTAKAASGFEFRKLDRLRVKGKTQAAEVYELLGRKGEVPAPLLEARAAFERALEAYFARRWDEAEAQLRLADSLRPGDGAVATYRERIADLRARPPAASWDGAYEMHTK